MKSQCYRQSLADGAQRGVSCRVDVCCCGHVHLTIGALTLRLEAKAFRDVGAVIAEAVHEMESRHSGPQVQRPNDRSALN